MHSSREESSSVIRLARHLLAGVYSIYTRDSERCTRACCTVHTSMLEGCSRERERASEREREAYNQKKLMRTHRARARQASIESECRARLAWLSFSEKDDRAIVDRPRSTRVARSILRQAKKDKLRERE